MPLSLLSHSALALFAQRTHIPTSARSIGFCVIWVCISSSLISWAARVAGSDFKETTLCTRGYLPFRLSLWHDCSFDAGPVALSLAFDEG